METKILPQEILDMDAERKVLVAKNAAEKEARAKVLRERALKIKEAAKKHGLDPNELMEQKAAEAGVTLTGREKFEEETEPKPTVGTSKKSTKTARRQSLLHTSKPAGTPLDPARLLDYENFKKSYASMHEKSGAAKLLPELEKLPEYQALSSGKKMLAAQMFADRLYSRVIEEGKEGFEEKMHTSSGLSKFWKGVTKGNVVREEQKAALERLTTVDVGAFVRETADGLLKTLTETKLESYLDEDKKTVLIEYAEKFENTNPYIEKIRHEYNRRATALGRIPSDWKAGDAKRSDYKAYRKALEEFEVYRNNYLIEVKAYAESRGEENPKTFAATHSLETDYLIKMSHSLFENPEMTKSLRRIGTQHSAMGMVSGVASAQTERAGIMAASFGVTKGLLKWGQVISGGVAFAASPVIGGLVGYYRGKDRARAMLAEQGKQARRGNISEDKTQFLMSTANIKIHQLKTTLEQLDIIKSSIERNKLLSTLKTQADFIETKIEQGHINYGDDTTEDKRFALETELIDLLYESRMILEREPHEKELQNIFGEGGGTQEQLEYDRARSLTIKIGTKNFERASSAQQAQIKRAAWESAGYGALFGGLGAAIAYYSHEFKWSSDAKNIGQKIKDLFHSSNENVPSKAVLGLDNASSTSASMGTEQASTYIPPKTETSDTSKIIQQQPATPDTAKTVSSIDSSHATQEAQKTVTTSDSTHTETTATKEATKTVPPIVQKFPSVDDSIPGLNKEKTTSLIDTPSNVEKTTAVEAITTPEIKTPSTQSLAEATIGKGQGTGQALFDLEKTAPKDVQEILKGNEWESAKALRLLTADDRSAIVGEGSRVRIISENGVTKFYLDNTLKPGKPQLLGHIEGGKIVSDNPDLTYSRMRAENPSAKTAGEKGTDTTTQSGKTNPNTVLEEPPRATVLGDLSDQNEPPRATVLGDAPGVKTPPSAYIIEDNVTVTKPPFGPPPDTAPLEDIPRKSYGPIGPPEDVAGGTNTLSEPPRATVLGNASGSPSELVSPKTYFRKASFFSSGIV